MANEYSSLSLLKDALKISDTDRDDLLNAALTAASRAIDATTGRRFWLDTVEVARKVAPRRSTLPDQWGERLMTDDIGNIDNLTVEVGRDGEFTDVTSEVLEEPPDALQQGEPVTSLMWEGRRFSGYRRVRITARWGWPAVPAVVDQATLLQATRLFRRKDSPEGVLGSAEWGVARLSRVDPDVQSLIQHLVLPGVA